MWSFGDPGLPLGWLLVALLAVPVGVALFFGWAQFRNATPLAFRCTACTRTFGRAPHRRFPRRCPHCKSTVWNAPAKE